MPQLTLYLDEDIQAKVKLASRQAGASAPGASISRSLRQRQKNLQRAQIHQFRIWRTEQIQMPIHFVVGEINPRARIKAHLEWWYAEFFRR